MTSPAFGGGGLPALDWLPGVVEAADGLPVLFDSGVRSGATADRPGRPASCAEVAVGFVSQVRNAQTTRNGDLFVGWGSLPYISEFSPSGKLLFNAEFPAGISTYRAYRLPWSPGV